MRRGLVHALAWTLSTGAAMTLSWWGVDSVMSGTAYDRPRALPIGSDEAKAVKPQVSSTRRAPSPSVSPTPTPSASPTPKQTPNPKPAPTPPKSSTPPAKQSAARTGTVKGYTVSGGRAVFDVGETSAELVSATPDAGWQMQVWKQPEWIRVTFTKDGRESSVFYTWNGHPPTVEFDER
ncbi:hypothetical protein ACIHCQ_40505 [Streptomyces sp. NPDC052236]|uniref:hypothetical protein n=1 Tax=Streptomyces sp. NPDC052236 TaxID=3365686 RepID=UPI0037D4B473